MTRQLLILSPMFALAFSLTTADVFAGCGGGRRVYHHHRYVQPVVVRPVHHVVQPTIVAQRPRNHYPTVPAGSTLTLPANFLGDHPGSVLMVFNNVKLPVQMNRWTSTGVNITLPPMAIRQPVLIRLDIVLPHGKLGHTQRLYVTPPANVVLHSTSPTSPLPTQAALSAAPAFAVGPAVAPAASAALPPAGVSVQPGVQPPFMLPGPPAAAQPGAVRAGTPSQPILLPPAGGSQVAAPPTGLPQPNAAAPQPGSGLQLGTPSRPIVLPPAGGQPANQQPIVLPQQNAGSPQPGDSPQLGTPSQPIVLPPAGAQPEANSPIVQDPSAEADPMANNPILNEHRIEEEAAPAPAANQGSAASFFTMIGNLMQQ